jgi:NADPH:quinone reductase-like Zn-dependent oxidoreductase
MPRPDYSDGHQPYPEHGRIPFPENGINRVIDAKGSQNMSRIVQFTRYGAPEVLEFKDIQIPAPADNEVRIKVKAIGLNRAESMWRKGEYVEEVRLPARLGYEIAGTVEAVGAAVTHVAVGDVVSTVPAFSQNDYGMYGELVLAPAHAVVKHPSTLSFEEAVAIWNPSSRLGVPSPRRGWSSRATPY